MENDRLRALPPFAGLSDAGLARVAACAAELEAEAGQVVALADDRGTGMFVLEDGNVAVELRGDSIELGPGDFFGELALLVEDGARVARVRATSKVCCLIAEGAGRDGYRLLGFGHQRMRGIKAGVVVDPEKAERAVRAAVA